MVTISPEKVLEKLKQLQATHDKNGNTNRAIGVDTLAMLFHTSFEDMLLVLEALGDKVAVTYRTVDAKKTGKNKVAFVNLLQ